jgi:hypothetical protein
MIPLAVAGQQDPKKMTKEKYILGRLPAITRPSGVGKDIFPRRSGIDIAKYYRRNRGSISRVRCEDF